MLSNLKKKKILVTGCAGFISSFIAEKLIEKGAFVYGIDNLSSGSISNINTILHHPHFKFIKNDICKKAIIDEIIPKVDYILHTAVRGLGRSTDNPLLELKTNIGATLLLLEAARKYSIQKFIYTSSASVYGNPKVVPEKETDLPLPLSPYGVSKLAAERYCIAYYHLYGIPIVCLRYFNTYGPRQRHDSIYGGVVSIFINDALYNRPLTIYGTGNQTRDFTYIHDTVDATISSFHSSKAVGKVINISGGKEYTVNFLAKKIKKISGNKNLKIKHVQKRLIDNIDRRLGDISLAKKILFYNPSTPLTKGLQETFDWNKEELKKKKN